MRVILEGYEASIEEACHSFEKMLPSRNYYSDDIEGSFDVIYTVFDVSEEEVRQWAESAKASGLVRDVVIDLDQQRGEDQEKATIKFRYVPCIVFRCVHCESGVVQVERSLPVITATGVDCLKCHAHYRVVWGAIPDETRVEYKGEQAAMPALFLLGPISPMRRSSWQKHLTIKYICIKI